VSNSTAVKVLARKWHVFTILAPVLDDIISHLGWEVKEGCFKSHPKY
jgi:hypothetical protein